MNAEASSPLPAPIPIPSVPKDQDRFTGANCSPEKRKAIIDLVKAGTPTTQVAKLTHSAPATVEVVRNKELPEWRTEQSGKLKRYVHNITQSLVEMTPEELLKVSVYERTVSLGIVLDKIALLDGEPSLIVEHRHTVDLGTLAIDSTEEINVTPVQIGSTLAAESAIPAPIPSTD